MNQTEIEQYPSQVKDERSLAAFRLFRDRLKQPVQLENGDQLAFVNITCYADQKLLRYRGAIKLVNHVYNTGFIGIANDEKGFYDENTHMMLNADLCEYSLGRSGTELIIDSRSSKLNVLYRRIDLEEINGLHD